jgi:hypothetical protein
MLILKSRRFSSKAYKTTLDFQNDLRIGTKLPKKSLDFFVSSHHIGLIALFVSGSTITATLTCLPINQGLDRP